MTTFDLYVDSLKSITGSITGKQTLGLPVDLPLSGPAALDVVRVLPAPGDLPFELTEGPTPGSFVITGPPGQYQLTPSHPEYQDFDPQIVTLGAASNTVLAPFELTLRLSQLSVDAFTQLGGTDVDGAVFDRSLATAPCTSSPATPVRETIPTVGPKVIDLAPGDYCLRISKFDAIDPTREIAFPAIVQVTVPTSVKGAAPPNVATVIAPLPALRPTLTGKLVAKNSLGGIVELVASPPPEVSLAFTQDVSVSVNGTTIPNQNANSTANDTATAVAPPVTDPQTEFAWTYQFTNVPYGENKITAPVISGYTPGTATTQTVIVVSDIGPTAVPDFVYTLSNSQVEIPLGPGTYPSLDPAFTSTDARAVVNLVSKTGVGAGVARNYSFDASTNTLVINDVAPENGLWTLSFDDALHAPFSDDRVKIKQQLNAAGRREGTLTTSPVGDLTRLTGRATEQAGTAAPVALSGDAVLTLAGPTTYTLRATTPPDNSPGAKLSGTTYIFDVTPGTYTLTTTKSEYLTRQLAGLALTSAGTMLAGQNVAIQKQSTITVRALNRGLTIPINLRVDLLNVDNNSIYGPMTLPAAAVDPTDPSVVFNVPAGNYRARTVTAGTQYPQQTSTPDTGIGVGGSTTIGIVLPRITRFNVTGPPTATVSIPGLTAQSEDAGTTVEFTETTTTTALSATVSATGYRTKIVEVLAELFTTTPVTLLPNVTVTGTITAPDEALGNVLTATDGTTTLQGSITGNTYRVAGLTANADGTAKSWTVNYTKIGVGTGSSTAISVSSTAPATGSATGSTITITPRPVDYNFTVTTGASTKVVGASVTITPTPATAPAATDSAGKTTAVVDENVAFTWTVKKANYLTRYGSFPKATSLADVPVAVSMVAGVSGTVTDGAPVSGATVVVCPQSSSAPCTPVESDRTFNSTGSTGAFNITSDLLPGIYTVWASTSGAGAKQGSSTLTIAADGGAILSPSAITIAVPTP